MSGFTAKQEASTVALLSPAARTSFESVGRNSEAYSAVSHARRLTLR